MNIWDESFFDELLEALEEILQEQERDVIAVICRRLKAVGELNPTSAKQMARLAQYQNADLKEIRKIIKKATKLSEAEIERVFEKAAQSSKEYADTLAQQAAGVSYAGNVEALAAAAAKRYKESFLNLSDTYAFKTNGQTLTIRQQYVKSVNKAVASVSTGTMDYHTAIRQTVKEMSNSGLRVRPKTGEQIVEWESGYTRRLDSSVRMNVLEGARQLSQEILNDAGTQFATGWEISAHDRPAPDHATIQGRQYTRAEYETLNASLKRPIGTLNCMHIAFPIIYGVTKPTYTDKQLADMQANANREYEWQGKKYTGYECTQKQRQYETAIRRARDLQRYAKEAGDSLLEKQQKRRVRELTAQYKEFSESVGLSVKLSRTRI